MSFFHPSPAASARSRRTKDGQGRINTSGGSRRPKDGVKSREERSPAPRSPVPVNSIYGQQNVGLDQVPDLPISGKTSPTSAASPSVSAHQPNKRSSGMYNIPLQLVTPASLQQYLDTDQDDEVTSNMTDSLHLPPLLPTESNPKDDADTKSQATKDAEAKEVYSDPARAPLDDAKSIRSVKSETADSSLSKTTTANESIFSQADIPLPMSRSTSYAGQAPLPHERSFTPPAPPMSLAQSQSPPLFMSPMPIRAHAPAQHFMTYQNTHSLYGMRGPMPAPDAGPGPLQSPTFYSDYSMRPSHTAPSYVAPAAAQRQQNYEGPTPAQPKTKQRSYSYAGFEDDTNGLLHRISSVLPDFEVLLDRYREASGQLTGDAKATEEDGKAKLDQKIKEKDGQIAEIAALNAELKAARDALQSERDSLQSQLEATQKNQNELQAAALAHKRSRDAIHSQKAELQTAHDESRQQLRQAQVLADQLRAELARSSEAKANALRQLDEREKSEPKLRAELQASLDAKAALERQLSERQQVESKLRQDVDAALKSNSKELHEKDVRLRDAEVRNLATQEALRLEAGRSAASLRKELEAAQSKEMEARSAWRGEVEASQKREAQLRDAHKQDREALARQWAGEHDELAQHLEARSKAQAEQHRLEKDDAQQTWRASQAKLQSRTAQLEAEAAGLRAELARARSTHQAEGTRWARTSADLRALAARINSQNGSLQQMVAALGEAGEVQRPAQTQA